MPDPIGRLDRRIRVYKEVDEDAPKKERIQLWAHFRQIKGDETLALSMGTNKVPVEFVVHDGFFARHISTRDNIVMHDPVTWRERAFEVTDIRLDARAGFLAIRATERPEGIP